MSPTRTATRRLRASRLCAYVLLIDVRRGRPSPRLNSDTAARLEFLEQLRCRAHPVGLPNDFASTRLNSSELNPNAPQRSKSIDAAATRMAAWFVVESTAVSHAIRVLYSFVPRGDCGRRHVCRRAGAKADRSHCARLHRDRAACREVFPGD